PGEGTWVVDPETGRVTFTPEPGFDGDPTPVRYAATKVDGTPVTGELSIHYLDPAGTGGDRQAQAAGASVLPRTGFDLGPAGQLGALLIALGAAVSTGVSWGRRRQLTGAAAPRRAAWPGSAWAGATPPAGSGLVAERGGGSS